MVSAPPLSDFNGGGVNLEICQSFVGTKFYLTFMGGVKNIWLSNIYY